MGCSVKYLLDQIWKIDVELKISNDQKNVFA